MDAKMDTPGTYRIDVYVKAKVVRQLDREGATRRDVIREADALYDAGEAEIASVEQYRGGRWRGIYAAGNISQP